MAGIVKALGALEGGRRKYGELLEGLQEREASERKSMELDGIRTVRVSAKRLSRRRGSGREGAPALGSTSNVGLTETERA